MKTNEILNELNRYLRAQEETNEIIDELITKLLKEQQNG